MKLVMDTCRLRPEVLKGDLTDAIFAADFGHVIEGEAPAVYQDPDEFFRNTHPAEPLKKLVSVVFQRLADQNEAGAVLRLSTGFGGGKSHTLIALWHLAKNVANPSLGAELLPAAGRPGKVIIGGVDGEKFGSLTCIRHEDLITTHSLWGELAYQLGGKDGYAKLQAEDRPDISPDAGLIRQILPKDVPTLILLDELVAYAKDLKEQGRDCLVGFIRKLVSEVQARKQTVLVISDPAGQAAYRKEATSLAEAVFTAGHETAGDLDDVLGRKVSDFDPIGDEAAQVIVRRLFEKVENDAPQTASAEYYAAYKRVTEEHPGAIPSEAATQEYAKRIVDCYPFHPRLLETAQDRLGPLPDYQKSRGTLRLFARILRDIWESKSDTTLITAGDLQWTSQRIQADLLNRLNKDQFKAAVDADIVRHAGKLDADFSSDAHRRVASALLLESLPMTPKSAMDRADITLATLRPSDVGNEPSEAIDRLYSICWHTYKDDSGLKFQFRVEPNVNKLIEERAGDPSLREDARVAVRLLAQDYFKGHTFSLVANPDSPKSVSDSAELKLVLSESEALAQAVCDNADDSEPAAKVPRRFRNAIFGIAPAPGSLNRAIEEMTKLRAAEQIAKEHAGDKLVKAQLQEIMPRHNKRAKVATYRAFNRVVFQGRPSLTLEEKYLVPEDGALESVNGQAQLMKFLLDKQLIYQHNDALDTDLLLDSIVKGSTPSLDHEGAYPASAVHERALACDKLRLMQSGSPVRNAIVNAISEGKLIVRRSTGEVYDRKGVVSGPEGRRERIDGKRPSTLQLHVDVLVAPTDAPCAACWVKVDEDKGDKNEVIETWLPTTVQASNWEEAAEYAAM